MKNKKRIALLNCMTILTIPLTCSVVVSCSNDFRKKIDEANNIYSKIIKEVNQKELGNPDSYVQNIFDFESFKLNTNNSLIHSIDQSNYTVELTNIDYEQATKGILKFKLLMKDKGSGTKLNTIDSFITIKGYKKIEEKTYNDLLVAYNDLSQKELKFNDNGLKWIKDNFNNINENIFFDDNKKEELGYIGNLLQIPVFLNNDKFTIHSYKVNIFNQKPIVIKEYGIDFNIWILLGLKDDNKQPLYLPLTLTTNIKNSIPLRTIKYIK